MTEPYSPIVVLAHYDIKSDGDDASELELQIVYNKIKRNFFLQFNYLHTNGEEAMVYSETFVTKTEAVRRYAQFVLTFSDGRPDNV